MIILKYLIAAIIITFSLPLTAQIITDRPDQTESPFSVPKGSLQIESGIQITYEGDNNSERNILLPTNLFRLGLSNSIELRILSQWENIRIGQDSNSGISDLEIGTKIWLAGEENAATNVGWLTHVRVPIGSAELSNDDYGFSSIISIDHSLGEKDGIGYNLGYSNLDNGEGDLTFTFSWAHQISSKLSIYIEPYGRYANFEELILNVNGGIAYLIKPNIQYDFSFGTSILEDRMNFLSTGFSFLFK